MEEIRALLVRYCDLIDAANFDAIGELFADAALTDENGNEIARDTESTAAFYRSCTILYEGSPRTKHLVLNTVFEDVAADLVIARSSYLVLQATADFPLQPIITGRYVDRFERSDGRWRFRERRFFVDLAGDLSRHLTYEI